MTALTCAEPVRNEPLATGTVTSTKLGSRLHSGENDASPDACGWVAPARASTMADLRSHSVVMPNEIDRPSGASVAGSGKISSASSFGLA